jgi:hypothetical protein
MWSCLDIVDRQVVLCDDCCGEVQNVRADEIPEFTRGVHMPCPERWS